MLNIPSLLCLAFLGFALFKPTKWLLIAAFALPAFGSLAILPPALTGGISLLVGAAAFMFLLAKVMMTPGGFSGVVRNAMTLKYMGLLTLFTIVAVIGAFTLPKIFIGDVYVIPLRPSGRFLIAEPLQPTSGNLTQSAYLVISFLTAAVFAHLTKTKDFARDFSWAIIAGGAVTAATGLMDLVTSMVGMGDMLDIFRNASYAFMTEGEISGVRRVVGLMPEASAFGTVAVTNFALLLFGRNLFSQEMRNKVVMPLALLCGALAGLSTSSTAYVALMVVVAVYFWTNFRRLNIGTTEEKRQALGEFTALAGFALLGLILILSFEETRNTLFSLVDTMILKKTQSASFTERSSWNEWAMNAFYGTYGMGVGVGGVRTSDFFINILASTGVIGAFFFGCFLIKIVFAKTRMADPQLLELIRTSKLTLIPILVMQLLVGTIPDYGVVTGALFGVIIGAAYAVKRKPAPQPASPPASPTRVRRSPKTEPIPKA
ncbi:hypothetical protein MMA231_04148 (plasmid) [Asticcacaulis sp. MM231]